MELAQSLLYVTARYGWHPQLHACAQQHAVPHLARLRGSLNPAQEALVERLIFEAACHPGLLHCDAPGVWEGTGSGTGAGAGAERNGAPETALGGANYLRADELRRAGRPDKAVALLHGVLKDNPKFAPAHNDLGVLYFQKLAQCKKLVLKHLFQAVSLDSTNQNALHNLVEALVETGRPNDAAPFLMRLILQNPADSASWTRLENLDRETFYRCLRAVRLELARQILAQPAERAAALHAGCAPWQPARQLMLEKDLHFMPLDAADKEMLAQLRTRIAAPDGDPRPLYAATLFERPQAAGWPANLWELPSPLAQEYLLFLLCQPPFFHELGEIDRYADFMEELLNYLHRKIVLCAPEQLRHDLCIVVFNCLSMHPLYFSVRPLKTAFRQRAEILERLLSACGNQLNWSSPPSTPARQGKIRLGVLCADYGVNPETYAITAAFEHLPRDKFEISLITSKEFGPQSKAEQDCRMRGDRFVLLAGNMADWVQAIRALGLDVLLIGNNITCQYNKTTQLRRPSSRAPPGHPVLRAAHDRLQQH